LAEAAVEQHGYSLVLRDASLIDANEIKSLIPGKDHNEGEIKIVQPEAGSESHNELATILILALSEPIITATALWLLETYKSEEIEYKVTVRKPDGTEKDVHLKIKRKSSEAPKAQIIKQIAEALKIPEKDILSATT
jgi:hypothetical protein